MMIQQLVLAIRGWKPEVIVCDDSYMAGEQALVREAMHEAFRRAADAAELREQIAELGLKRWAAKKLLVVAGRGWKKVPLTVATTEPLVMSGESASDIARIAAEAFGEPITSPTERRYAHIECRSPEFA